jgi:hypothetical protein
MKKAEKKRNVTVMETGKQRKDYKIKKRKRKRWENVDVVVRMCIRARGSGMHAALAGPFSHQSPHPRE